VAEDAAEAVTAVQDPAQGQRRRWVVLAEVPTAVRAGGGHWGAKAVRAAGGSRAAHGRAPKPGGEGGGNLPQPGRRCWRVIAGGLLLGRMGGGRGRVDEISGHRVGAPGGGGL
jgi:hypothetical protein